APAQPVAPQLGDVGRRQVGGGTALEIRAQHRSASRGGQRGLAAPREHLRLPGEIAAGEAPHFRVRELVRAADDLGDAIEVMEWRRRAGRRPLERRHLPGVLAGANRLAEERLEEVPDEDELACEEREREEARPPVQSPEPLDEGVLERIEQAPLLAGIAGDELAGEDERDADEGEPEVGLPQPLVELSAE